MELKKFITELEYQQLAHFEYKDIWKQCMEDLYYAMTCHSCGNDITPFGSVYNGHCSKKCWLMWAHDNNRENCAFGENCKKCKDRTYTTTLANAGNLCLWFGLNPMGTGKKYSKYGLGIEKDYTSYL